MLSRCDMRDGEGGSSKSGVVPCPICRTPVPIRGEAAQKHPYRPFCSARCQSIDLGNWLGGRYAVPGDDAPASTSSHEGSRDGSHDGSDDPGDRGI